MLKTWRGDTVRKNFLWLAVIPALAFAQAKPQDDVWEPLRFFLGAWTGTGKGQAGISQVERKYQFVLNGKFIQARNKSVYQPQEKNPQGEIHEDWGFFSFDRNRKQHVFRQFHVEGFVNQYKLEAGADKKRLVFVSENIENIPPGWQARETCKIINDDEFIEVFEIAAPGKEFEIYSENSFKRENKISEY